ncbi:MAG: OmpA family protein [Limisphaerales bacterium]
MKNQTFVTTLVLSLGLLVAATGCHHRPVSTTVIPDGGRPSGGSNPGGPMPENNGATLTPAPPVEVTPNNISGTPEGYAAFENLFSGPHNEDRDKFKGDTVYFDFDSAVIKPSEEAKLQDLAAYFKGNQKLEGLVIEGHCDERGTEKYNLSLGERRALASREYLGNLGVDVHRVKTVTYGASRPVDPGHDEAAWKKNRRDEFVLITPK